MCLNLDPRFRGDDKVSKLKRFFTSLNLIFTLEILVLFFASLGFIPREAVLFLTGIMVFYMIFSPIEDALWLTVASIPLFAALPVSEGFDTLANWRISIAVLFLCLFFKQGISIHLEKRKIGGFQPKESSRHYWIEYFTLLFLIISAVSFFVADYKVLAIKKFLFILNIFLLFLITRNSARTKEQILKIWQAAAAGGIIALAVAGLQFLMVLFIPLARFWDFWTENVIKVFYGQNLANLLSYSNTWFAYYKSAPPTLRLFSLFPDSHSFAMFFIIILPIFLGLAFFYAESGKKKLKRFFWVLSGFSFLGISLSGSRGAWISAIPVFAIFLYLFFKKYNRVLIKKAGLALGLFLFVFILSLGYSPLLYKFQSWQPGGEDVSNVFLFERAKSISDALELSNKGRLEIWRSSLDSISRRPLLGVGIGNYVRVLDEDISAAKMGASAHNLYLDFASEIGIFGSLIFVGMLLDILRTSWLVFKNATEDYFKFFGLMAGFFLIWAASYSFFDVVLLNDKVLLLFMAVMALLYNLRNIELDGKDILFEPILFFKLLKKNNG